MSLHIWIFSVVLVLLQLARSHDSIAVSLQGCTLWQAHETIHPEKFHTNSFFLGKSWIKCPYYLTDLSEMGVQRIGVSLTVRGAAHTFAASQKHTKHFWSASFRMIQKGKIKPSTIVLRQKVWGIQLQDTQEPMIPQGETAYLWKTTNPGYHSYQIISFQEKNK